MKKGVAEATPFHSKPVRSPLLGLGFVFVLVFILVFIFVLIFLFLLLLLLLLRRFLVAGVGG
jgi:uncharacterized phage infection (PIP) family protein YhgE